MRNYPTMFARRTGWRLEPNAISQALQRIRKEKVPILDLTESNPTRCGFRYTADLLSGLSHPACLAYEPDPKGYLSAREMLSRLYSAKGTKISPEGILLTASTSEAYSFLFQLLCNPGDQVLVPRPSYPLFEYLAVLHEVEPKGYRLRYDGRWRIDFDSILPLCTEKAKAIVAVHPNHPTGSSVTLKELLELSSLCQRHRLSLIADEVFAEYLETRDPQISPTLAGSKGFLTFALGGISKFLGLPQMKLSWIAATGPQRSLQEAIDRLEVVADTYLSVNTPAQRAFPRWVETASGIQGQIRQRIRSNRGLLRKRLLDSPCQLLAADGGWTAVLRVPSLKEEEGWVLELLREDHVLVYPGYFFDFEEVGVIVVSLLPLEEVFQEGIRRLLLRL